MNHTAYKGPRDPINAPINQPTPKPDSTIELMAAARKSLYRWAARFANSGHARAHRKKTVQLVEQIDEWLEHNKKGNQ